MTAIVKQVWQLLDTVGVKIYTAAWIHSTTENSWADFLSHWRDPDNWQLSNLAKQRIQDTFSPWDMDQFTDNLSTTVPTFNSHFATPGTLAHVIECGARAILVVPEWLVHDWWPLLLQARLLALPLGGPVEATVPGLLG